MVRPFYLAGFGAVVFAIGIGDANCADPWFSSLRLNDSAPHFRVGVAARKIGVEFSVSPTASISNTLSARSITNSRTTGPGDPGLFLGGPSVVTYANGSAGGEVSPGSGNGFSVINELSQLSDSGRSVPSGSDFDLQVVEFNSSEKTVTKSSGLTGLSSQSQAPPLKFSDEEIVVGPYLQFVIPFAEGSDDRFLNFVTGYSYFNTSLGTGLRNLGVSSFRSAAATKTTETNYTYRYDYYGEASPTKSFPFSGGGLVYDGGLFASTQFGAAVDLRDPSKTAASTATGGNSSQTFAFIGFSKTDVDVELHEIPFGIECGRQIGKSTLAFNAGATLNIVNLGLYNRTDWYQVGNSTPVLTEMWRDTETPVRAGAYLGVNFTHPLSDDGRVYFEAHGSYRWVDSIESSIGRAAFTVDLSSWEGGIGIGCIY